MCPLVTSSPPPPSEPPYVGESPSLNILARAGDGDTVAGRDSVSKDDRRVGPLRLGCRRMVPISNLTLLRERERRATTALPFESEILARASRSGFGYRDEFSRAPL